MRNHFKNYDSLIDILSTHKLKIKNKQLAKQLIQERTYYALINGFKQPFINSQTKQFTQGISMVDIYFQYGLEQRLKNILLTFLLRIETRYKESIAHQLGMNYGDIFENYMNPSNFVGKNKFIHDEVDFFTETRNKLLTKRNTTPTKHYSMVKGYLPPWIFLHDLTFSPINSIFKLLKPVLKRSVISYMLYDSTNFEKSVSSESIEMFNYSMALLVEFRNILAHNSRIYRSKVNLFEKVNYSILTLFLGNSCISKEEFDEGLGNSDFMCLLLLIKILSGPLDSEEFVTHIVALFDDYTESNSHLTKLYFKSLGLQTDFISRLAILDNNLANL